MKPLNRLHSGCVSPQVAAVALGQSGLNEPREELGDGRHGEKNSALA